MDFSAAQFVLPASFAQAAFLDVCKFEDAQFVRLADFTGAAFSKECAFARTRFGSDARFDQARFDGPAGFNGAEFLGEASFRGVVAGAALTFNGTKSAGKPNFEGGVFASTPSLRKLVKIKTKRHPFGRWRKPGPAAPEPEAEPPRKAWPAENPTGYDPAPAVASPYPGTAPGSAWPVLLRLCLVWALAVAAFVPFYLSQRPIREITGGDASVAEAAMSPAQLGQRAYRAVFESGPCIQGSSLALGEAIVLSAKNALVIVPWESEQVSRRVYACLYGLEQGAPAIPYAVTLGGLAQALIGLLLAASAVFSLARRR